MRVSPGLRGLVSSYSRNTAHRLLPWLSPGPTGEVKAQIHLVGHRSQSGVERQNLDRDQAFKHHSNGSHLTCKEEEEEEVTSPLLSCRAIPPAYLGELGGFHLCSDTTSVWGQRHLAKCARAFHLPSAGGADAAVRSSKQMR